MSNFEALHLNEELIKRLPLPLAQLYRRAHNAKAPLERYLAAFYFWEAGLKLLGAVCVIEYVRLGKPEAELQECLENLARPSLGQWWELVRRLVPVLADAQVSGFVPLRDLLLGRSRDDLPRCAGLDAALLEALDNKRSPGVTVYIAELFDRLVRYRNKYIGHGAVGHHGNDVYQRMGKTLLLGIAQLFAHLDVLAGRQLVYISEVRQVQGQWLIERAELMGENASRLQALWRPREDSSTLPDGERLYGALAERGPELICLHPLLTYDPEANECAFLNARRGRSKTEYLCYTTGATFTRDDLGGEQRALLAQALGMAEVSQGQADAWAARAAELEPAPAEPAAGAARKNLGEFELISELGRGGMGIVYRAWQPSLGRQVAVKSLARPGDPKAEDRFRLEIKALGRVEHPHVVKIFTSGSDGEQWYYVMELVEGANLAAISDALQTRSAGSTEIDLPSWQHTLSSVCEEARRKERPLSTDGRQAPQSDASHTSYKSYASYEAPELSNATAARAGENCIRQVVELIRQTADAAHALHEAGVIHRDIKPGNILVNAGGTQATLVDLGLAQIADEMGGRVTRTQKFVGTLRYASPEQMGNAKLDRRTDVYSLGATLWELLTLRPIFGITEDTPPDMILRLQMTEPEHVRKYNPRVPPDLETIVRKCLEKDPDRRYLTAKELADDLGRFLNGEAVLAQPPTMGYVLSKQFRKHRMRIAAGAGVLALLFAGVIFAFVHINSARKQAVTAFHQADAERREKEAALARETDANTKLAAEQLELEHRSAESFLQSGVSDCVNGEGPGLGLASILAAYEAAPPDDPLRRSARLLMAGWERSLATRFVHEDQVEAVAFHPKEPVVITAGWDGAVHFWDARTGMRLGEPLRLGGKIWAAAFSPDGKWVAAGDSEGYATIWDAKTRQVFAKLPHEDQVQALAFSPDSKLLATGCGEGLDRKRKGAKGTPYAVQLWDVQTRQIVHQLPHDNELFSVAFNPEGTILATGYKGGKTPDSKDGYLALHDVKSGKRIGEPVHHGSRVWTVSFSPDGKYLFTGDWAGQGRLYDAHGLLDGHPPKLIHDKISYDKDQGIIGSAFTPDSQWILVASRGKFAQFWDVPTGRKAGKGDPLKALRSVRAVAISSDGKDFMYGSRDGVVRLFRDWDIAASVGSTIKPVGPAFPHPQAVLAMAVSADGKRLATACKDNKARLWDLTSGKLIGQEMGHDGPVTCIAFSADGQRLVTGSEDKTVRQWSAADGKPINKISVKGQVTALAVFADAPKAIVATDTKDAHAAHVVDLSEGKLVKHEPLLHEDKITAVAVTPDGRYLITGSRDRSIKVWDRETWQAPPNFKIMYHQDDVSALAVDHTGRYLLSGSYDNTARLWNLADQTYLQEMRDHEHNVLCVAFSPDSRLLLTGADSADRTARLWDAATGKQIGDPVKFNSRVLSVAFLPEGQHYLVARESGDVDLWPVPQPVPDEPRRIHAWIRARTVWTRDGIGHRRLSADEWNEALKTLAEEGGPFPAWGGK
ncbi:MAG TPA: protein kinase [Gemmataceae bacterium]|jgi:WD40 repeat protein/serine/threonine protein kinase|nr:protein kinase [Gemmataceae bacterium]